MSKPHHRRLWLDFSSLMATKQEGWVQLFRMSGGVMSGILDGINVLDLSRILAGPYTAQMLSDLGANVTKIEAPWGDDTRGWGPPFTTDFDGERVAAYFLCCNRGKSILQLNLKDEKEQLMELIEWADVIIENFKPGTLERLIGDLPKDTIICSISGYGATGPRRDEPGYDLALQARSGIMSITGEADGQPVKVGVAWIDIITGLYAGNAILAALLDRERTGTIRHIDVSLWDCAVASLANQAQNVLASGVDPSRMGSAHPNLVPYRAFEAKDGWFVVAVGSDTQWSKFCTVSGISDMEEWRSNEGRIENRKEIESQIQTWVAPHTRAELEQLLQGIPCAPINTISEALEDVQSVARGTLLDENGVTTLASPLRFMQPQ
ncbi:MAG: CoA transferase [Euryarchaeota archaeon]|nr:CoA transferase [Euryarchaeota archaeon]